jgi:hypothetical protein
VVERKEPQQSGEILVAGSGQTKAVWGDGFGNLCSEVLGWRAADPSMVLEEILGSP